MRYHSTKQIASVCLLGALMACPSICRAGDVIHSGWDLFPTVYARFQGVEFQGVPLGTYTFGPNGGYPGGTYAVGNADTIIYRSSNITNLHSGPVPFTAELVAMQLRSVNQVDFGAGLGYYYITLQSDRGGPVSSSTGLMDFDNGMFTDQLTDYVDVRFGALTGPIVLTAVCALINDGATWTPTQLYQPAIPGVNYELAGPGITSMDFWVPGVTHWDGVNWANVHIVPEPSGLALFCVAVLCLALKTRRGQK
jgi:hypothetical protein